MNGLNDERRMNESRMNEPWRMKIEGWMNYEWLKDEWWKMNELWIKECMELSLLGYLGWIYKSIIQHLVNRYIVYRYIDM